MVRLFTVTGITGNVGSHVAQHLLASGHAVRGVVRDENSTSSVALKSKGVQLAVASYSDVPALITAFTGVEAAFIMLPPCLASEDPNAEALAFSKNLREAIVQSKVPRVVVLSSITAHRSSDNGPIAKLYFLEKELESLTNISVAFIRAGYFAENTAAILGLAKNQAIFPTLINQDAKVPLVTTQDIGDTASKVLLEDFKGLRIIELEGPERLTYAELAKIVSEVVGKPVANLAIPEAQWQSTIESWGLSKAGASQMAGLFAAINAGTLEFEGKHEHIKGTHSYKQYVTPLLNNL
jgi:uncharacterized protein YbjT (DUF2867 family)